MIKNIKGHGPVCYIPMFMEIGPLVPKDKIFKVFKSMGVEAIRSCDLHFHFLVP